MLTLIRWRAGIMIALASAALVGVLLWWFLPPTPRAVLPGIDAGPSRCIRITFSPDGQCVATWHFPPTNQNGPRLLRLWNVADGQLQTTLHRGERQLESLTFSADGQHIAGRWFDRGIEVWDRAVCRSIAEYRQPAWAQWNPHMQIVYTADNRLLAYGPDPGSGKLWDVVSGKEVRRLFRDDEGFGMAIGDYPGFFVGLRDFRLQVWHLAAAELRGTYEVGEIPGGVVGLSDDGRTLAGYHGGPLFQRRFRIWHGDDVYDVPAGDDSTLPALAPDGSAVAVVFDNAAPPQPWIAWLVELLNPRVDMTTRRSRVRIINLPGGRVQADLDGAESAQFAPDGRTVAVSAVDGTVYLYDWPLARPWGRIFGGAMLAALVIMGCRWLIALWRHVRRRQAAG